ncbi:MAG: D-lyxose/D-mannose family sugar isomerase [Bacteroidetes bacterium]|nr:MAG: D-lyxose/D-mannose family sugar isomerase [Bacteroidota bacterium]
MKRSEINRLIGDAIIFLEKMNFWLPHWATWSPEMWKKQRKECKEIIENGLGWDLTDFGTGNFLSTGLLLFTLRNGNLKRDKKTYSEKIMIVEEGQVTPMHFHWSKMEDIINRGGGNLMMDLYGSDKTEGLSDRPFEVRMDGIRRQFRPGDTVRLKPGDSITLYQGLYHRFYGEPEKGRVLVGEVSAVNDDHTDNRFYDRVGRFPTIIEDEPPLHLLVGDYTKYI